MKKLKKLSKNNKPKLVLIYGVIASGKLTVAQELQKITDYKLFHNHMLIDLVHGLISDNSPERSQVREDITFNILETAFSQNEQIIMTHAYASNYIAKNGTADPVYVKKLEKLIKKYNGMFYPVFLIPNKNAVMKRLMSSSRKKFSKLIDTKIMDKYFKEKDFYTPAPVKNNLIIDNTKLSAKKVASNIKEYFSL